ncbi:hypothetical protein [Streptomyces sp. 2A115]|uniref:hypothetical protein n=1 Tax=Streptomyces sp. 2A115 TaxID=3457439 RepID=UPI003FD4714E
MAIGRFHVDPQAYQRPSPSNNLAQWGVTGEVADPESTPADVARLARDPEAEVRRRAAEDTRLSPADAVRLLNDPAAYVRGTAIRGLRLPARVLAGLLHDRDTACAAVTDPGIPVPVPHRILAAAAVAKRPPDCRYQPAELR